MISRTSHSRRLHTTVYLPIAGRFGEPLPVLLCKGAGGITVASIAFRYCYVLRRTGRSLAHIDKFVSALGLLHDFYVLSLGAPTLDQHSAKDILAEFAAARRWGTVDVDGNDPTGLYWLPVQAQTVHKDLTHLMRFSKHCVKHYGHLALVDWEYRNPDNLSELIAAERRSANSILKHISDPRAAELRVDGSFGRSSGFRHGHVCSFPIDKLVDLVFAANNIRDVLILLLLAFGGPRVSEILHIFVGDIGKPDRHGQAMIFLGHPSESAYSWIDGGGKRVVTTRSAFLQKRYGRVPRTFEHGPYHVGWKGMMWDEPPRKRSEVYWSEPEIGRLWWALHERYMRLFRVPIGDRHPYYFVNIDPNRPAFGEPLKMDALNQMFERLCRKIGLRGEYAGECPHGLRHLYGYYLRNVRGLDISTIKDCMHHVSAASTEVYAKTSRLFVRELLAGNKDLAALRRELQLQASEAVREISSRDYAL